MTLATLILAVFNLSLSNVLWWLVVGLIAGFLASRVMRGGGYGLIGDIVVGLIGACILLAIFRAVTRGSSRRRLWGR